MSESAQTPTRPYRSNMDLVATDEMLAALMRGMARLRLKLESSQQQPEPVRANPVIQTATSSKATALTTATAQSADEAKCWFYASDGAALGIAPATSIQL